MSGADATSFSPGDPVRQSGVYLAVHYSHRMPHEIVALQGETFPDCNHCSHRVHFELLHPVDHLTSDHDFAGRKK